MFCLSLRCNLRLVLKLSSVALVTAQTERNLCFQSVQQFTSSEEEFRRVTWCGRCTTQEAPSPPPPAARGQHGATGSGTRRLQQQVHPDHRHHPRSRHGVLVSALRSQSQRKTNFNDEYAYRIPHPVRNLSTPR